MTGTVSGTVSEAPSNVFGTFQSYAGGRDLHHYLSPVDEWCVAAAVGGGVRPGYWNAQWAEVLLQHICHGDTIFSWLAIGEFAYEHPRQTPENARSS